MEKIKTHRRSKVQLTNVISMRFEQDLFEYLEANKGNMNRSEYANHLIRKAIEYGDVI